MSQILTYFTKNHLVSNMLVALILAGGLFSWYEIRKEELPDFTFDTITISTSFPGASPEEVEESITLPMEHELSDLDYVRRMDSVSRRSSSSIRLELERGSKDIDLAVTEIQNRILNVKLPSQVEDPPKIRYRKTSQKAVIDVGLYFKNRPLLSAKDRRLLQKYMRDLENQLLQRPEVSLSDRDAYLSEEIHIIPELPKLYQYQIGVGELKDTIAANHTDIPLGVMDALTREQVRMEGKLKLPPDFRFVPIRTPFTANAIYLKDVATAEHAFADTTSLVRINGFEAVIFNVVKSSRSGIVESVDAVREEVEEFKQAHKHDNLEVVLLDDESYGVRNRLSIIAGNAALGFALILLVLSFFLSAKAALWVCMGIPFSISFTLILAYFMGYTINNMTLAGVIIAMGMLVDDAIVVSENISRLRAEGMDILQASLMGTQQVFVPILASITTTIVAFLPLLAFEGRLALLTTTIPPIISFILVGSLLESILILPGHLAMRMPRFFQKLFRYNEDQGTEKISFAKAEGLYIKFLQKVLHWRFVFLFLFLGGTIGAFFLFRELMHFTLFPDEKVQTAFIIAEADPNSDRYATLQLAKPLESFLLPYVGKELVGIRTLVGYRRYRPSEEENVVSIRLEFDEEKASVEATKQLLEKVRHKIKTTTGFKKIRLSTQAFGSDTGSSLEILVQAADAQERNNAAEFLAAKLRDRKNIGYVEIDKPAHEYEYVLYPDRVQANRLGVHPVELQNTLRAALAGIRLYSYYDNKEEIVVRLRFSPSVRRNIQNILQIPVVSQGGYQIPLRNLVRVERKEAPSVITRVDGQRILKINADLAENSSETAIEVAASLEKTLFREMRKKFSGIHFAFDGEVKNTRESTAFFEKAVVAVIVLILIILTIQFKSLWKPVIILTAIIPAWASIIYVFLLHGRFIYGFFAVIGGLGLAGVVVNGAILLLDKLEKGLQTYATRESYYKAIAELSATRFRAVFLTTVTTVVGLLPTAYGIAGYDSMLSEMMLAMAWGLFCSTTITLLLVPVLASFETKGKLLET